VASLEEIDSWLRYWHNWLEIDIIVLFGGEPMIHPNIVEICQLVRKYYPTATLRLITNGYLLDRVKAETWFAFEPFEIQVSVHRLDHESIINKQIKKILQVRADWKTIIHDNATQHQQIEFFVNNFKIYKSKFKDFVTPYQLIDNQLHPFQSDPIQAHSICGSPNTPVLYKGALYKCPPVANLIDYTGENWNSYQACRTWEQLPEFVAQIGCAESVCSQCPANATQHSYSHFDPANVKVKQKSLS